jgi:hypothetical protein
MNLISILLIMYQGHFSAILDANNAKSSSICAKVSTARFLISKRRLVDIGCDPGHVLDQVHHTVAAQQKRPYISEES